MELDNVEILKVLLERLSYLVDHNRANKARHGTGSRLDYLA